MEIFVATRMRKEGKDSVFTVTPAHLIHVEEFIELMNAITKSRKFSDLPKLIKERGNESMYTILFDEAEERGEKRGERRGERRGEIIGVIKFCHDELHLPPTEIVKKIMPRFDLKKDEAEKYVAEVLNLELV